MSLTKTPEHKKDAKQAKISQCLLQLRGYWCIEVWGVGAAYHPIYLDILDQGTRKTIFRTFVHDFLGGGGRLKCMYMF